MVQLLGHGIATWVCRLRDCVSSVKCFTDGKSLPPRILIKKKLATAQKKEKENEIS